MSLDFLCWSLRKNNQQARHKKSPRLHEDFNCSRCVSPRCKISDLISAWNSNYFKDFFVVRNLPSFALSTVVSFFIFSSLLSLVLRRLRLRLIIFMWQWIFQFLPCKAETIRRNEAEEVDFMTLFDGNLDGKGWIPIINNQKRNLFLLVIREMLIRELAHKKERERQTLAFDNLASPMKFIKMVNWHPLTSFSQALVSYLAISATSRWRRRSRWMS